MFLRLLLRFVSNSSIFSLRRFQFRSPPRRSSSSGCGSLQSAKQFIENRFVWSSYVTLVRSLQLFYAWWSRISITAAYSEKHSRHSR